MKDKLKQLGGLFITFAVVGVTTFGGGYAMLPALQREVCLLYTSPSPRD